ncbi:MAG: histidine kinase dimerization/phospho-acceptor domain-containing protein [Paracoccaceae bacterium]
MKKTGLPTAVLLAIILGISAFAGVGFYTFQKDLDAMRTAGIEDIAWTAGQLELELGRFREMLIRFQVTGSDVDVGDVNNRFDILWSRIALFQQGPVGKRLASYDRDTQVVSRLFDKMRAVDRRVVGLKNGDIAEARAIQAEFSSFSIELNEFSRLVTLGEESEGRKIRDQLQSGLNLTMIFTGLAGVFALFGLGYIILESLKFQKLARENNALATTAEKASRVKSQFLTMMSHELRTPMNGVLGLLALTKQQEMPDGQKRLIEKAEQSAQHMVSLLADILDFSSLQADNVKLELKPFEITHLAKAVNDRFAPLARREGINFDVVICEGCPKHMKGDFRRLRQAFGHLAQYIVETAGVRETILEFGCLDNALTMRLTFEYASDGGEWTPDLILGGENRTGDKFATDALGPAIARGLIETMQGNIRVDNPDGNRISVHASIPVEVFEVHEICVDILANSTAMAAICRAALKNDDIVFYNDSAPSQVHIVLIESGNESEGGFLRQAAKSYPDALVVALGLPINSEPFDFTIDLPLDFQELREIVFRQIA